MQSDQAKSSAISDMILSYTVSGLVTSAVSAGVGGLVVQIVDKNVGADVQLATATTNAAGYYTTTFTVQLSTLQQRSKTQADLQVRVLAGATFLAASSVGYNAPPQVVLNVEIPAGITGLPTEYEALTQSLKANYAGKLGGLQENADRSDITFLANKTGWDARAVALAALADQFSSGTPTTAAGAVVGASPIDPEFYYALFRSGLPANASALYAIDSKTVGTLWTRAVAQGVIPASLSAKIPAALDSFETLSAAHVLDVLPVPNGSSMRSILQLTFGTNVDRMQQFGTLYAQHQGDLAGFWDAAQKTFGPDITAKLKLDGQLAFLTLNNATLIDKLHQAEIKTPLTSVLDLVRRGYYQTSKWDALMPGVPSTLITSQLRLSFPTAVVAEMVNAGTIPLMSNSDVKGNVYQFFVQNQGKYELGMQPIDQYITDNKLQVDPQTVTQIKRLQRVYQITPGDQPMNVLLSQNVDSAYQIVHYGKEAFARNFGTAMGGEDVAMLTFNKAQLVYNTVVGVTTDYLSRRVAPALGNGFAKYVGPFPDNSNPGSVQNSAAAATLETLFGSMDYCRCDDCRSILSPSAYLVDLLNFTNCQAPPPNSANPQTVLFARRPDIQYLPLTCDNTNTAMPYIDIVNETLEYYTANGSLSGFEGFSTDASVVTSEELLACPQNVNDQAYKTLEASLFPPPLPFDRSLELSRRLFQQFKVQLPDAMIALRASDAIERPSPTSYGWRDTLMEQIGFSRYEYAILTDNTLTLQQLYGYPGSMTTAQTIAALSMVQDYIRRLDLQFTDLASILQTRFINPNAVLIPMLEKLAVPFSTLAELKNGTITVAQFNALLPTGPSAPNPADYGGNIAAWVTDATRYAQIMGIITLTNPTNNNIYTLAGLQLRYSNPDNTANTLQQADFVRLVRFFRLWQKLGLSIEQTDDVITAFGSDFSVLVPRLGFALQVLNRLGLDAAADLGSLLACWAPIDVYGANSLYSTMFLNPTVLQQDNAFAMDENGNVLQDNTKLLASHEQTLLGAFNMTHAEFVAASTTLGYTSTTPLTLANISEIYRRGWLAHVLQISVVELLALIQYTNLNPFAMPDPNAVAPAEPAVIRFIRLVQDMSAASLDPVAPLYLLWNQDISGKSAPASADIAALAFTLRSDFAAVNTQFQLVDDPKGTIAISLMTLVYGAQTTNFFFGLINNTMTVAVPYGDGVPPAVITASNGRLTYDDLAKQLSYAGVLDAATLAVMNTAATGHATLLTAIAALNTANQAAVGPFFTQYPELLNAYQTYAASSDPLQKRRTKLLAALLPPLIAARKQEQALSAVSAAAGVDVSFANAVFTTLSVLHAANDATKTAIIDLTNVEQQGLEGQFFLTNDTTKPADETVDAAAVLSYAPGTSNTLPPGKGGSTIAGIWSGYLDCPQNGFYNITVTVDPGANVTLSIGGTPVTLSKSGSTFSNSTPISLTAGNLSAFVLTATNMSTTLSVLWESTGIGWQAIPGQYLYSQSLVDRLAASYVRFLKASSLVTDVLLDAQELTYVASNADLQIGGQGWVNALVVSGNPDAPTSSALCDVLRLIMAFARIKQRLSPSDDRFLNLIENPPANPADAALTTLTHWDPDSLTALLTQFFGSSNTSALGHIENFRRVYDAYAVVKSCGISAAALISATTNDPTAATVSGFESAVRARYSERDWLNLIKPINNTIRELSRDALVPYVLQLCAAQNAVVDINTPVNTPDTLFEYLLMDVEMDCCMETSRIRDALSSVQLFIERSIRSLELNTTDVTKNVDPGSFNASMWIWMKRYRVWEANREVFLWPENWLYPELRDDQSPFFTTIMGKLLQGDITDDTASYAYLEYLKDLEEVAKLQPCGMFYVPPDSSAANSYVHAIARTTGSKRTYYYRSYDGASWSPWQQIPLNIEDNPAVPVVWNNRLFLFWAQVVQQRTDTSGSQQSGPSSVPGNTLANTNPNDLLSGLASFNPDPSAASSSTVCVNLYWSEYYNGKWQHAKSSDTNNPVPLLEAPISGPGQFDRSQTVIYANADIDPNQNRLWIMVAGQGEAVFCFYNTHSPPAVNVAFPDALLHPDPYWSGEWLMSNNGSAPFSLVAGYDVDNGAILSTFQNTIITTNVDPIDANVVIPQAIIPDQSASSWAAPFFYEDSCNTFYVEPTVTSIPLWTYPNFGVVGYIPPYTLQGAPLTIKNVVAQSVNQIPKPNPVDPQQTLGVVNANPIARYVTEDAYISRALGSTGIVQYNGTKIGPSGAVEVSVGASS